VYVLEHLYDVAHNIGLQDDWLRKVENYWCKWFDVVGFDRKTYLGYWHSSTLRSASCLSSLRWMDRLWCVVVVYLTVAGWGVLCLLAALQVQL